jgi:hypothetical protein
MDGEEVFFFYYTITFVYPYADISEKLVEISKSFSSLSLKKRFSSSNDSYENKESVKERKGEDPLKERIILFSRQMSLIY